MSANPSPSNGGHLGFLRITRKVTTLVRDVIRNNCTEFGVDPFSCSSNGDEMVSANQNARHGGHLGFSDPHEFIQHLCSSGRGTFPPSLVSIGSAVLEKKFKMSQPIRGHGGHLGCSDPRENIQHLSGTT